MTAPRLYNFDDLWNGSQPKQLDPSRPAPKPAPRREPVVETPQPTYDRFGEQRSGWDEDSYKPGVIPRPPVAPEPQPHVLAPMVIHGEGKARGGGLASAIAQTLSQTQAGVDTPVEGHYDDTRYAEVTARLRERASAGDPEAVRDLAQVEKTHSEATALRRESPFRTALDAATLGMSKSRTRRDIERAMREDVRSGRAVTPEELRSEGVLGSSESANLVPGATGAQQAAEFGGSLVPFIAAETAAGAATKGVASLIRGSRFAGNVGAESIAKAIEFAYKPIASDTEFSELGRIGQSLTQGQVGGAAAGAAHAYENDEPIGETIKAGVVPYAAMGAGFHAAHMLLPEFSLKGRPRMGAGMRNILGREGEFRQTGAYIAEASHMLSATAPRAVAEADAAESAAGRLPLSDKNPEAQARGIAGALSQVADALDQVQAQKTAERAHVLTPEQDATERLGRAAASAPEPADPFNITPRGALQPRESAPPEPPLPTAFEAGLRNAGVEQPPLIEQVDLSKNIERINAEQRVANEQAALDAARQQDQQPRSFADELVQAGQGDAIQRMKDNDLIAYARKVARHSTKVGEEVLQRVRDEIKGRGLESKVVPIAVALGLGTAAANTEDEKQRGALLGAAALTTGMHEGEGQPIHEGQDFYSRLERHIETFPAQWDRPRSAQDWLAKLSAGNGPFSKAEFETTLKPALEEQIATAKHMRERPDEVPVSYQLMEDGRSVAVGSVRARERWLREGVPEENIVRTKISDKLTKQDVLNLMQDRRIQIGEHRYQDVSDPSEGGSGSAEYDERLRNLEEQKDAYEGDASDAYEKLMAEVRDAFPGQQGALGVMRDAIDKAQEYGDHYPDKEKGWRHFLNEIQDELPQRAGAPEYDGVSVDDLADSPDAVDGSKSPWELLYETAEANGDKYHDDLGNLQQLIRSLETKKADDGTWVAGEADANAPGGINRWRRGDGDTRAEAVTDYLEQNWEPSDVDHDEILGKIESAFDFWRQEQGAASEAESEWYHHSEDVDPATFPDYLDPASNTGARGDLAKRGIKGGTEYSGYQRVPGGKNYREIALQWENRKELTGDSGFITPGHDYWRGESDIAAHLRMTEHTYDPTLQANDAMREAERARDGARRTQQIYEQGIERLRNGRTDEELARDADPGIQEAVRGWHDANAQVAAADAKYEKAKADAEAAQAGEPESVLNAFEHQSSWTQAGREKGFKKNLTPQEFVDATMAKLDAEEALNHTEREIGNRQAVIEDEIGYDRNLASFRDREDYKAAQKEYDDASAIYYNEPAGTPKEREAIRAREVAHGKMLQIETETRAAQQEQIRLRRVAFAADEQLQRLYSEQNRADRERARAHALINQGDAVPDTPFRENKAAFGLTSAKMLIEAAEGDFDRVAWSTAENRNRLASLAMEPAKITYDQEVTGAVKNLLKVLGEKANIEQITMDGYTHWSVKLTPEMKAKIKKFGFPILAALAATGLAADKAKKEDETSDDPQRGIAISPMLLAAGVLVVRKGKAGEGDKMFDYFEHSSPKEGLTKLDAKYMGSGRPGAEQRRPNRPKMLHVRDIGSYVEPEFRNDNTYYIRVPKKAIYDASKDPDGIVAKLIKVSPGSLDLDKMERAFQKAGYLGYFASEADPHVKKIFGAHDVIKPEDIPLKLLPAKMRRAMERAKSRAPERDGALQLYANPVGPALALVKRAPTAATVAVLGAVAADSDNDDIRKMSPALLTLAALNAIGSEKIGAASDKLGGKIVEKLSETKTGKNAVRFINPDALLSPEVKAAIIERERTVALGRARAKEFSGKARKLGPSGDREVSDIIENEDWEGLNGKNTADALGVAVEIADEADRLTQAKLASGVIEPHQAIPNYLNRKYAEYDALAIYGNEPTGSGVGSKKTRIGQVKRRTLDIPIHEAESELASARASGDQKAIDAAQDKLDEAVAVQMSQRLARGEIREASYRIEGQLEKGWADVGSAQLFKVLSNAPDVIHPQYKTALDEFLTARQMRDAATSQADFDAAQSLMDGAKVTMNDITRKFEVKGGEYQSMPDTPGLGVLRGMVVKREVANSINGIPEQTAVDKLLRWWKQSKTIFNPGTHAANVVSNTTMAHMGGLLMFEQPKYLKRASADMKTYGKATRALAEAGVLDVNAVNATGSPLPLDVRGKSDAGLRELVKTTRPETAAVLQDRAGTENIDRPDNFAETFNKKTQGIRKLYSGEDNIFRVAMYLKRLDAGDAPDVALKTAHDTFGNFRTRSPLMRVVRGSVAPFILWPAKLLPVFAKNIVDHPYRYLSLVAAWGALNEYSEAKLGKAQPGEDIDVRDARKFGYFFPGMIQLPLSDKEGSKGAIDLSRWTPWSGVTDVAQPGSPGAAFDDRFPRILQPSGPVADIAAKFANNYDTWKQEPRYKDYYGVGENLKRAAEDASDIALPSILGFHVRRLIDDAKNRDDTKFRNDLLGPTGLRPRYMKPGQARTNAGFRYSAAEKDIQLELSRALRQTDDPQRQQELVNEAMERMDRAMALYNKRTNTPARAK